MIVKNKITGEEDEIRAKYLIGADGNQSSVREKLKIERKGKGKLQVIQSVLFKAERLDDFLKSGFGQFMIEREDFHAFLTTYGESRWALMFYDDIERSDEMVKQQIIEATGIDDLEFDLPRNTEDIFHAKLCASSIPVLAPYPPRFGGSV